ncbi:MAG: N-succinylarginine dihydrolase, partial [Endozoicomonas sp.]
LTEEEQIATNQNCLINDTSFTRLSDWVNKHYRDQLIDRDLADSSLVNESRTALDELTTILQLGSVYPFQK